MTQPTFVVVGVYKCGTTWLHEKVVQHPEVFLPDFKELHYFSTIHSDGAAARPASWYEDIFAPGASAPARGDISPGYMVEPACVERIADAVPSAKIVAVLRDPATRAYAHYWYLKRGKFDPGYSFDDLTRTPSVDPPGRWNILEHGFYARNLAPYIERFGRERVHVILNEDIRDRPDDTLSALFAFLGVDPAFQPVALDERTNAARGLRSRPLYWAQYRIARALELSGLGGVRRAIKATGLPAMVRRMNTSEAPNPPITPAQRALLVAHYRADIEALQVLIDRDLSAWLR